MKLHLAVLTSGLIRLFRNGAMMQEGKNDTSDFAVAELGAYRAEVRLGLDGETHGEIWQFAQLQIR